MKTTLERQRQVCLNAIEAGEPIRVVEWFRSEDLMVDQMFPGIIKAHRTGSVPPVDEVIHLKQVTDFIFAQTNEYPEKC